MAITAYSDFFPALKNQVPGCSDELLEQAIYLACRDFCVESEAYIVELTAIDSVADQKDYTLTIPSQFDPIRVFTVHRRTATEVTDGDDGTLLDPTAYEFERLDNNLKFYVAPFSEVITGGMLVHLVLAPQEDSDDSQIDFDFIRRYARYIKAGALWHLRTMPDQQFFNERVAEKWRREFRAGVSYAKRETHIRGTTRTMTMTGKEWL